MYQSLYLEMEKVRPKEVKEVTQRAADGLASNVWLQRLLTCVLLINVHQ